MNIRLAKLEDASRISGLIRDLSQKFFVNPDGSGAEQFLASVSEDSERNFIQSEKFRFLVLEDEGELAGFIAMRDISHIFHLFIASSFQGKGLSRRLWNEAKDFAALKGHVGAFTVNSSLAAVPVYERFGFVGSGEVVKTHGIAFLPMQLRGSLAS